MSLLSTAIPTGRSEMGQPEGRSSTARASTTRTSTTRNDDPDVDESSDEFYTTDEDRDQPPSISNNQRRDRITRQPVRNGARNQSVRYQQAGGSSSNRYQTASTSRARGQGGGVSPPANRRRTAASGPASASGFGFGGQRQPLPPLPPQAPLLCVICKKKPSYSRGGVSYPTCGTTCAAVLSTRCEICYAKEKNTVNGKTYSTCGMTCAKKLKEIRDMCAYCKVKPKLVKNNTTYPHCGRTCRDADEMGAPLPLSRDPNLAIETLKVRAAVQAPCFLEVPKDHDQYDQVCDLFSTDWTHRAGGPALPTVRRIFKVSQGPTVAARHSQYKAHLNELGSPVSESRRWVSVRYSCQLNRSNNGIMGPCKAYGCSLCDILNRNVFSPVDYPGYVTLSGHAAGADKESSGQSEARGRLKAMLFTKVIVGDEAQMTSEEISTAQTDGSRYDVVQLVRFKQGRRQVSDRILVFNSDAISPRYLILYK